MTMMNGEQKQQRMRRPVRITTSFLRPYELAKLLGIPPRLALRIARQMVGDLADNAMAPVRNSAVRKAATNARTKPKASR
jgi:hypothetical protein